MHRVTRMVVLAAALSAGTAYAQKSLDNNWYVNKEYGFKLRTPAKWGGIPLQPDEKIAIAKFNGPKIEVSLKEGQAIGIPELLVLRFANPKPVSVTTGTGAVGAKPDSAPDGGKPEDRAERNRPKTFDAWVKKSSGWEGVRYEVQDKETKYGKLAARENVVAHKGYAEIVIRALAVEFPTDEENIVLVYVLPEPHFGKWENLLRQSARTFTRIGRSGEQEDLSGDDLDSQRRRHAADVTKVPGWTLEETARYFIKIHNPDREFVDQIKEHIELIRTRLEEDFPPIKPIAVKSVLRVCKDSEEYYKYGGPGGSAGYWSSGAEELVIYDDKNRQRSDTFRTMYHEAFHQYIFYRCGELSPHSWYNEGTGDYYAGATLRYGKFEIRPFQWRTDLIRQAVHGKSWVPMEKILRYSQQDYYGKDVGLCYAQGWSIIYFLREGKKGGAKAWKKEWEQILPTYLKVLTETRDKDKALEAAFKGIDVLDFEAAWADFTKGV